MRQKNCWKIQIINHQALFILDSVMNENKLLTKQSFLFIFILEGAIIHNKGSPVLGTQ
jgi:hypothetical protein